MTIQPIETRYAGCCFRSRLEARWAVFFDALGIKWQYEPEGYVIGGQPYLPDFLLTECGTWVEVKGSGAQLDIGLMLAAAEQLPEMPYRYEPGPRLMILGPIPEPTASGDWGWIGLGPWADEYEGEGLRDMHYGFGMYHKNRRPWALGNTSCATASSCGMPASDWLVPALDNVEPGVPGAYIAARCARFEHGKRS
jgi:hypothetical protein